MNAIERFRISPDLYSLKEIRYYYNRSNEAINCKYSPTDNLHYEEQFCGYTKEEVRKEADEIRNELSHTCSFYAMAYVESLFRIDSFVRVKHKCKGDVTPLIKKMVQSKEKLSLVRFEDLLDAWEATHADDRELFREVKQAFQFRHWMAHGRYWKPNDNIDKHFDFEDIYSLVSAVESLLGGELRTQDAIGNPLRINELYKI